MFFIGGISNGIQQLIYTKLVTPPGDTKGYNAEVFMTYTYFSFFFIPLFKWNRQFFVGIREIDRNFKLDPAVGMRILRDEDIEIRPQDLTEIQLQYQQQPGYRPGGFAQNQAHSTGNGYSVGNAYGTETADKAADQADALPAIGTAKATEEEDRSDKRYCPHCGSEIEMKFIYCPYCGEKL